jgi:tetratricopeptide (TPR) repeat protein
MQAGEPGRAAPMLERAVRAFVLSRGEKAQETLESKARLAESYDDQQFYNKSEPIYKELVEAKRGDAMAQSADLNGLALSLDGQGKQDEALPIYMQALKLREEAYGADYKDLPEILNNLGRVYYMKNDFGSAEPLYLRAIAIDEKALQPSDPQLEDDYKRIAALYEKKGEADKAAEFKAKAEAVKKAGEKPKKAEKKS